MKPSSSILLAISVTVLLIAVFEAARAQETGPNRGVPREPVSPVIRVPEGVGTAASQPGRGDGTGNPVLGRDRRPLYRFNKSDVLEISFALAAEFNQTATVQPDGYITLRDAGHLVAEGLSAEELEAAVATAYARLLHDPQVTIGLKDFDRPYFIAGGEVGRPGKYELRGPITILFLGRFSPEKNCHLLVQAYGQIDTAVKLVLAGGGRISDAYAQELRQHASDRVRILDYVSGDAFEELLTNAMLFVLPSDLEGLSLALLEAMGAGLCVLVSDIPENLELVEGAGFTFRHGDIADLKRMLSLLINADSLRADAGQAARTRIEEHYLWPQIAKEIEEAYQEMMGNSAGGLAGDPIDKLAA